MLSGLFPQEREAFTAATVVESKSAMRELVVEDEPRIERFVAKGLREQAYAVEVSVDGDDPVYKASINDYDGLCLKSHEPC